jgi:hypothetical protein
MHVILYARSFALLSSGVSSSSSKTGCPWVLNYTLKRDTVSLLEKTESSRAFMRTPLPRPLFRHMSPSRSLSSLQVRRAKGFVDGEGRPSVPHKTYTATQKQKQQALYMKHTYSERAAMRFYIYPTQRKVHNMVISLLLSFLVDETIRPGPRP